MNYANTGFQISEDLVIMSFFLTLFVTIWAFVLIFLITNHLMLAVPLYKMAYKAGYDYPFLAFIPFANYYLIHILPAKEYSFLGMAKTFDRKKGFIFYICVTYVAPFVIGLVGFASVIPIIGYLLSFVTTLLSYPLGIVSMIARAIMMIDLLGMYMKKYNRGTAIALGIGSLFVPFMFPVSCMVLCNREPDYGFGNYYVPIIPEEEE